MLSVEEIVKGNRPTLYFAISGVLISRRYFQLKQTNKQQQNSNLFCFVCLLLFLFAYKNVLLMFWYAFLLSYQSHLKSFCQFWWFVTFRFVGDLVDVSLWRRQIICIRTLSYYKKHSKAENLWLAQIYF